MSQNTNNNKNNNMYINNFLYLLTKYFPNFNMIMKYSFQYVFMLEITEIVLKNVLGQKCKNSIGLSGMNDLIAKLNISR